MLLVVVLSVSATFAVSNDDIATEGGAIDDNINLVSVDEQDELSAADVEEVVEETSADEDVLSAEETSNTVTNNTFFNYFENDGTLKSDVTNEELIFEGEFSNIPNVDAITINKTIKLTGNNAILNNISLVIKANDVVINSFKIITDNANKAIFIEPSTDVQSISNVQILNSEIIFNAIGDDDAACAIYAQAVDNIVLKSNIVRITGNRSGNKVLYFSDCLNATINDNSFVSIAPSSGYPYPSWGSEFGMLYFNDGTSDLIFKDNLVDITCSDSVGSYPTTVAIVFVGNNVTLDHNNIICSGDLSSYAVMPIGTNSKIINNKIKASSPNYACGVDLEGSSNFLVDNNEIIISSDFAAYGIYSGMTSGGLSGIYSNNNISVTSYFVVGVELGTADEIVIGNTIDVKGNYTVGVGGLIPFNGGYDENGDWVSTQVPIANRLVQSNTITSTGSNVGNTSSGDRIPIITVGVYSIPGNITISNNKITTNGEYTVIFENSSDLSVVTKNNLVAKSLSGDESVKVVGDVKVSDNTPTKTTPSNPQTPASNKVVKKASKITAKKKTFKAKTKTKKYTITLKSGKKAIKNVWVTLKIKGKKVIKAKTNAKGKATFKIKTLKKKGKYTATIKFAGNKNYKATSKKVKITVKK